MENYSWETLLANTLYELSLDDTSFIREHLLLSQNLSLTIAATPSYSLGRVD